MSQSNAPVSPEPNAQIQEAAPQPEEQVGVKYVCGDCGHRIVLKQNDPVRCEKCGYRILYKMRTKRLIQFEAR